MSEFGEGVIAWADHDIERPAPEGWELGNELKEGNEVIGFRMNALSNNGPLGELLLTAISGVVVVQRRPSISTVNSELGATDL